MPDSTTIPPRTTQALAQRILELRIQRTTPSDIADLIPGLVDDTDFPGKDGTDYEAATDAVIQALAAGTIEVVFHPARADRLVLDLRR
jgi:hypothetical protein